MPWKPNIQVTNSFERSTFLGYSLMETMVSSDGQVAWSLYQIIKTACDVDITYFPFDTQTCSLIFSDGSQRPNPTQKLIMLGGVSLNSDYSPNAQWTLVDSSAEISVLGKSVIYTLMLQRKPSFYIMNIIIPVVLLSILSMFTFVVPLQSGERASYAITVFLSKVVFMTIIASEFPKNSDAIPAFDAYLLILACLSTIIVIVTVVELRRDDEPNPQDINAFYRAIYKLGTAIMCKTCSKPGNKSVDVQTKSDDAAKVPIKQQRQEIPLTWKQVLGAMDIVFFVLSFVIISITSIFFFRITAYNPHLVENKYTDIK